MSLDHSNVIKLHNIVFFNPSLLSFESGRRCLVWLKSNSLPICPTFPLDVLISLPKYDIQRNVCTFIIVRHKVFMLCRADLMLCSCSRFKLQPHPVFILVIFNQYSINSNADFIEKDIIRETDPSKLAIERIYEAPTNCQKH